MYDHLIFKTSSLLAQTHWVVTYEDNILPAHWKLLLGPGVKTYEDNNYLFLSWVN